MQHSSFSEALDFGKAGESVIAQYLTSRGCSVLPVYEVLAGNYKGPRLYTGAANLVAPDMLTFKNDRVVWVEAKHKSVFSWHRKTGTWNTGVDKHHYHDYKRIAALHGWPVWLLFLHTNDEPDPRDRSHCPDRCPVGLFGCDVCTPIHHEHHNWGRHGMVYWEYGEKYGEKYGTGLKLVATLEQLPHLAAPPEPATAGAATEELS